MKLSIQIVNFRSRRYLRKCLFSISENMPDGIEAEVLVINNDDEALTGVIETMKGAFDLQILELQKNVGFGKAHNAGFEKSRGEYVLLLNPDTQILPGALKTMLDTFENDDQIGIVGPLLVDANGKLQAECFGVRRTPFSTIKNKIFGEKKSRAPEGAEIFETDWISGGAMLVRRDIFKKAEGFDENFFMYFEDVDLCLRAKKFNAKIAVNPKARIFHESGRSHESERKKKKHYYASQEYYLKKHFGATRAALVKLARMPYYLKNVYFSR